MQRGAALCFDVNNFHSLSYPTSYLHETSSEVRYSYHPVSVSPAHIWLKHVEQAYSSRTSRSIMVLIADYQQRQSIDVEITPRRHQPLGEHPPARRYDHERRYIISHTQNPRQQPKASTFFNQGSSRGG
jgi:hypothetical protein